MNNSNYWLAKAILKGLNDSMNAGDKRFVFVNYKLNHDPFTFDRNGNIIDESYTHVANYYLGNYIYSTYLLLSKPITITPIKLKIPKNIDLTNLLLKFKLTL